MTGNVHHWTQSGNGSITLERPVIGPTWIVAIQLETLPNPMHFCTLELMCAGNIVSRMPVSVIQARAELIGNLKYKLPTDMIMRQGIPTHRLQYDEVRVYIRGVRFSVDLMCTPMPAQYGICDPPDEYRVISYNDYMYYTSDTGSTLLHPYATNVHICTDTPLRGAIGIRFNSDPIMMYELAQLRYCNPFGPQRYGLSDEHKTALYESIRVLPWELIEYIASFCVNDGYYIEFGPTKYSDDVRVTIPQSGILLERTMGVLQIFGGMTHSHIRPVYNP